MSSGPVTLCHTVNLIQDNNNNNNNNDNNDNNNDKHSKSDQLSSQSSFSTYSSLFSNTDHLQTQENNKREKYKPLNHTLVLENDESLESDSDIEDIILLPANKNLQQKQAQQKTYNAKDYFPLDFQFITIIENKLNRYMANDLAYNLSTNQDILDKIRLQEISYRFSKSYF